jgi:hypothetical protein
VGTTIPAITGFSTKTQIVNPYEIENNDKNLLRNGWGITIGNATNVPSQVFNFTWIAQEFGIILTREIRATEHNKTPLETASKAMVEDAILLRIDFHNADQIAIESSIENINFLNRTPISYVGVDGYNIIWCSVNFSFEIKESI